MGRIERGNFQHTLPNKGSVPDLMDGFFQLLFRMDMEKTNRILNSLSDQEIEYLTSDFKDYKSKKEFVLWLESKVQSILTYSLFN
jgi:hypothetical protein